MSSSILVLREKGESSPGKSDAIQSAAIMKLLNVELDNHDVLVLILFDEWLEVTCGVFTRNKFLTHMFKFSTLTHSFPVRDSQRSISLLHLLASTTTTMFCSLRRTH